MKPIFLPIFFLSLLACTPPGALLKVKLISDKPKENIVASYEGFDRGGNTSVAHDKSNSYKWSGESPYDHEPWGYFDTTANEIPYIKRDRDLGQTFTIQATHPVHLESITVLTGFGTNVVREGMFGQPISIQLFEVSGNPVLNNNGTDSSTEALHGFPHNRPGDSIPSLRDDYYAGETYQSLMVISGGKFPHKRDFGFDSEEVEVSPDDEKLKGKYLRFLIPPSVNLELEPGKHYAFLIMVDKMGKDKGFTLANNFSGSYEGGHGIRRDGNGVFPPQPADPSKDFTDPANAKALAAAHFPADFNERTSISPGTNGYPDVCTWRDLTFFIEAQ